LRTEARSDAVSFVQSGRLNSWKEIAAFFDKDARTVRRWEATRNLPVHRVPGGQRGGVYAYVAELERWLREAEAEAERDSNALTPSDAGELRAATAAGADFERAGNDTEPAVDAAPVRSGRGARWAAAAAVAAVVVLAAVALFFMHRSRRLAAERANAGIRSLEGRASTNAEAQELYLRGLYFWSQHTEASLTTAADLFGQAIARDSKFAAAYAGLADSYILLRQYGHMADAVAYPKALAASRQALALDDESPEAHRAYAFVLNYWIWNFAAAEREFQRAIELRPGDSQTHHWYATSLYSVGRYADAMREIDTARRLKPDSITILANRGLLLTPVDAKAALAYLQEIERDNQDFAPVHGYLAGIHLAAGDYEDFLAEMKTATELRKDANEGSMLDGATEELRRRGPRAMFRALGEGFAREADEGAAKAMPAAEFLVRAGKPQDALHYLTLACDRRESGFLGFDRSPALESLRGDPRFQALLVRRNTPLDIATALKVTK
jgi:tetratricopeptide (TPR) repeat protein